MLTNSPIERNARLVFQTALVCAIMTFAIYLVEIRMISFALASAIFAFFGTALFSAPYLMLKGSPGPRYIPVLLRTAPTTFILVVLCPNPWDMRWVFCLTVFFFAVSFVGWWRFLGRGRGSEA